MPYGIYKYNRLVEECYYLSKAINTSYNDLLDNSLTEHHKLVDLLVRDNKRQQAALEKIGKNK